jgi:hypothetical protein
MARRTKVTIPAAGGGVDVDEAQPALVPLSDQELKDAGKTLATLVRELREHAHRARGQARGDEEGAHGAGRPDRQRGHVDPAAGPMSTTRAYSLAQLQAEQERRLTARLVVTDEHGRPVLVSFPRSNACRLRTGKGPRSPRA